MKPWRIFICVYFLIFIFIACNKPSTSRSEVTENNSAAELYLPKETIKPINGSPIEVIKTVADRIISVTPFQYQLILQPNKKSFDYVKYIE